MNLDLANKTAVVCSSAQGIGLAAAKELANMVANLILVARNEDKLKAAGAELSQNGNQAHRFLVADFSRPEELGAKAHSFQLITSVEILVNNTGGSAGGLIHEAKTSEFIDAFNQHLICNHIMVLWVKDQMITAGYGRIINFISTSAK